MFKNRLDANVADPVLFLPDLILNKPDPDPDLGDPKYQVRILFSQTSIHNKKKYIFKAFYYLT